MRASFDATATSIDSGALVGVSSQPVAFVRTAAAVVAHVATSAPLPLADLQVVERHAAAATREDEEQGRTTNTGALPLPSLPDPSHPSNDSPTAIGGAASGAVGQTGVALLAALAAFAAFFIPKIWRPVSRGSPPVMCVGYRRLLDRPG